MGLRGAPPQSMLSRGVLSRPSPQPAVVVVFCSRTTCDRPTPITAEPGRPDAHAPTAHTMSAVAAWLAQKRGRRSAGMPPRHKADMAAAGVPNPKSNVRWHRLVTLRVCRVR